MSQARSAVRLRGVELSQVSVAAIAMIALQFLVRLVIVPQSFWWEDDFFHLAQARRAGLTPHFLISDYNDHLEPLPNFLWWLLTRVTGSSWAPAAVLILVFSTVASTLMFLLLRELFGTRPVILIPLAAYLFSPLALAAVTWFASCVESLPMQVGLLGAPLAMTRLFRTGRRRWLVIALALHAVSLLTWEKGALVLPFMLGLQLLVREARTPVRERLRGLRTWWWAWLPHVVLLAAYVVLYLHVVGSSHRHSVSGASYLRAVRISLFDVLVPGLFGAPWRRGDALNTLYPSPGAVLAVAFAVLLAAVVLASFLRSRRAALGPWLLALAYVGSDIALVLWGRAAYLDLVARDPRYITDAVPVVLVCVTAAFLLPRGDDPPASRVRAADPPGEHVPSRAELGAVAVGACVIAAGSLLTTFELAPALQHRYSQDYVEGVLVRSEPDAGTSILDTPAPTLVGGNVDHADLLLAMGRHVTLDQPSAHLLMFDSAARLQEVQIPAPVLQVKGPTPSCGWAVTSLPRLLADVPEGAAGREVLRLGVLTGVAGTLTVTVDGTEQSVDVPAGLGYAYVVVPRARGQVLAAFDSANRAGACVTDVTLGAPATGG